MKQAPSDTRRTALYRHYDAAGCLLYVGISLSATARLGTHRAQARWADSIARVDVEYLPDRPQAIAAERRAIVAEKPRWNVIHNRPARAPKAPKLRSPAHRAGVFAHIALPRPETVEAEKALEALGVYFISLVDLKPGMIEVSGLGHRRASINIEREVGHGRRDR